MTIENAAAEPTDPEWQQILMDVHPDVFPVEGDPPRAQGWPSVGDGWRDLLERACNQIGDIVRADGGSFYASQIKEKFGTLRFYWNGSLSQSASDAVEDAIDLAEARSAATCDTCGAPGQLRGPGWLVTRCDAHAEGRKAIGSEGGYQIVVSHRGGTTYRRYDRSRDAFVALGTLEIAGIRMRKLFVGWGRRLRGAATRIGRRPR